MNQKSCEALPANYRMEKAYDFAGFSRENLIGLLLSGVLLVGSVLLALPRHPFLVLEGVENPVMRLVFLAGLFAVLAVSMRLLGKLTGYLTFRLCESPIEYVSMGIYILVSTGTRYVRRSSWIASALLPTLFWCAVLLCFCTALSERWFWVPFLMFVVAISSIGGKLVGIFLMLRYPKDTYVQDDAQTLRVYTCSGE